MGDLMHTKQDSIFDENDKPTHTQDCCQSAGSRWKIDKGGLVQVLMDHMMTEIDGQQLITLRDCDHDQVKVRPEELIRGLLGGVIGEDVDREGLAETPARVLKAWANSWAAGYSMKPEDVLKTFEDGGEGTEGQWIIVADIPIYSHCEHHIAPFFGTATIGYVSTGKVVGISKLKRLADIYAKRLQVQERLGNQIADALMEHLGASAAMVKLDCRHMCMESRGIAVTGSSTKTSAFKVAPHRQGSRGMYWQTFHDSIK